tara:strand:- start:2364 stop:2507 length:144 start_codon:yes stop_codon:yes gene_type:complete
MFLTMLALAVVRVFLMRLLFMLFKCTFLIIGIIIINMFNYDDMCIVV